MRIKGFLLVIIAFFLFMSTCNAYEYSYDDYNNNQVIYESDVNNNNSNDDGMQILFSIVFIIVFLISSISPFVIIIFIINTFFKRAKSKSYFDNFGNYYLKKNYDYNDGIKVNKLPKEYEDVNINVLKSYLPDYELYTLKQKLFGIYKEIQNAWMMFDYETLKKDCGDVLYNYYVSQLEVLKSNNTKNIITELVAKDIKIFDIKKIYNSIYISVYLNLSYYDYVIRNSNSAVISGSASFKVDNKFYLSFEYKKIDTNKWNCPNCGAVMGDTDTCDYCGTHIKDSRCEFVLNKKSVIGK